MTRVTSSVRNYCVTLPALQCIFHVCSQEEAISVSGQIEYSREIMTEIHIQEDHQVIYMFIIGTSHGRLRNLLSGQHRILPVLPRTGTSHGDLGYFGSDKHRIPPLELELLSELLTGNYLKYCEIS